MSDQKDSKKKIIRSPRYPSITLQEAIKRAKTFFDQEKYSQAPITVALKHWDYNPKSSPGLRMLSALIQYGLLDDEGSGSKRKVALTELGKALVLDQRAGSEERRAALKKAALNPSIYAELWKEHPDGLPSNVNLAHKLVLERKFNPDVVETFIADYRSTLKLANLTGGGIMSEDDTDIREEEKETDPSRMQRQEVKNMPETRLQDSRPWDLTIPLIGGGQAILRAPIPMSEENYDLLKSMLDSTLKSMKKAITNPGAREVGNDT